MKGNFGSNFAPVKEGEEYDVNIEGVGEKGDGIARVKGFVVFVPGVKAGDAVRIKITRVLRKVGFGEVTGESQASGNKEETTKETDESTEDVPDEDELIDESKDSEDFGEESDEDTETEVDEEDTEEEEKKK